MNRREIERRLAERGRRRTSSRGEVISMLLAAGGHVTADMLYERLRSAGSKVGRMTVFRTLDLLAEVGIVRPFYQGSGAAHFVLLEDGRHHHLVCMQCDQTVEFDECSLGEELCQRLAMRHDFQISGHLLEVYGVCGDCRRAL